MQGRELCLHFILVMLYLRFEEEVEIICNLILTTTITTVCFALLERRCRSRYLILATRASLYSRGDGRDMYHLLPHCLLLDILCTSNTVSSTSYLHDNWNEIRLACLTPINKRINTFET